MESQTKKPNKWGTLFAAGFMAAWLASLAIAAAHFAELFQSTHVETSMGTDIVLSWWFRALTLLFAAVLFVDLVGRSWTEQLTRRRLGIWAYSGGAVLITYTLALLAPLVGFG